MGNGMRERFNRSILDMLGTLDQEQKKKKIKNMLDRFYKLIVVPGMILQDISF